MGELPVYPGSFPGLSQTEKDKVRESECAGNGDKRETTVLGYLMSSFSVWRAGTQSEK